MNYSASSFRTARAFRSSIGATAFLVALAWNSPAVSGKTEIPAAVEQVIDREVLGLELRSPESFTYDPSRDEFLIADTLNQRIVVFVPGGDPPSVLDLRKSEISPLSIAIASNGQLYVTDQERGDLAIIDFRGRVEARLSGADLGLDKPVMFGALHSDDAGSLWTADRLSGDLIRIFLEENQAARLVPEYPKEDYRKIADVQCAPGGTVWVLSSVGMAVRGFRTDMTLVTRFASHGPRDEQVSFPAGFCIGPQGRFWIVDKFRHRVAIYSEDGTLVGFLGKGGTGTGEFRFPTDCLFRTDSELAVLDGGNSRVQVFSIQIGKR